MEKARGYKRLKQLFWYSDSEPNEILIAFCHIIALPAALLMEFEEPHISLILVAIASGLFQIWAVLWNGKLTMRLLAVQVATLISVSTVSNLYMEGLLSGSRLGWIIICIFAIWNTIRVFRQKLNMEM